MSDRSWEEAVRAELFPKVADSDVFVSLCPSGEPDPKFCVELGACLMYDKPLILLMPPGARPIPERLKRIADIVLEDCDLYTDKGMERIRAAIDGLGKRGQN